MTQSLSQSIESSKKRVYKSEKGRQLVVNINNNVLMIEVWLGTFMISYSSMHSMTR